MILEIVNNLLNKDGIRICVLCSEEKQEISLRSSIYSHIKQEIFEIKTRTYAKLNNGSVIYFVNVNSSLSVLRGQRFNKVYCREILTKDEISLWYTELALCMTKFEPLDKKFDKILTNNLWDLYEK